MIHQASPPKELLRHPQTGFTENLRDANFFGLLRPHYMGGGGHVPQLAAFFVTVMVFIGCEMAAFTNSFRDILTRWRAPMYSLTIRLASGGMFITTVRVKRRCMPSVPTSGMDRSSSGITSAIHANWSATMRNTYSFAMMKREGVSLHGAILWAPRF